MKTSGRLGADTSEIEVANISKHGIWLYLDGREYFLPYDHFPWFKSATIDEVLRVERISDRHVHWPDLDVDLTVDIMEHPERYPLVAKIS